MGHLRQTETLPTIAACPLCARKRTIDRAWRHVRLVPILLQKSAIVAARLLFRCLGTVLTIRSLGGGDVGSTGTDPWHRLRKTCIGGWWRWSDQLRKPA